MADSEPFCGQTWNSSQYFITKYLYGGVIVVLETIGTPFSILTVIIFAKNALSSSNILFTSLAISDLMVLLLGIPQLVFRIKNNHIHSQLDVGTYTELEKFADHYLGTGQKIFYNISLYQTMILAIWRYVAITHPLRERILCSVKMTFISVIFVYVLCFLYFARDLLNIPPTPGTNDQSTKDEQNIYFDLFYIIVLKLIPCTIVGICTVRFISVLRKSKIRRKEMISNFNGDIEAKEKLMNRTTKMVLGITLFFLTNNTGLTIARILILVFGPPFKKDCYPAISCINNLLVLIYTVIPFVVYYITSQQFRDNFKSLICSKKCVSSAETSNAPIISGESLDLKISNGNSTISIISTD